MQFNIVTWTIKINKCAFTFFDLSKNEICTNTFWTKMFKNVHCAWKAEGCMTAAEDPQGTLLMMVVVAPSPPPRRLYTEEEGKGTYQNL